MFFDEKRVCCVTWFVFDVKRFVFDVSDLFFYVSVLGVKRFVFWCERFVIDASYCCWFERFVFNVKEFFTRTTSSLIILMWQIVWNAKEFVESVFFFIKARDCFKMWTDLIYSDVKGLVFDVSELFWMWKYYVWCERFEIDRTGLDLMLPICFWRVSKGVVFNVKDLCLMWVTCFLFLFTNCAIQFLSGVICPYLEKHDFCFHIKKKV